MKLKSILESSFWSAAILTGLLLICTMILSEHAEANANYARQEFEFGNSGCRKPYEAIVYNEKGQFKRFIVGAHGTVIFHTRLEEFNLKQITIRFTSSSSVRSCPINKIMVNHRLWARFSNCEIDCRKPKVYDLP